MISILELIFYTLRQYTVCTKMIERFGGKKSLDMHWTSTNIDLSEGGNGQRTLDMSLMLVKSTDSRTGGGSGKSGENA